MLYIHIMKIFRFSFLIYLFLLSCNKDVNDLTNNSEDDNPWPYKSYEFDSDGNIIYTDFDIEDFQPSRECSNCHPQQFQE